MSTTENGLHDAFFVKIRNAMDSSFENGFEIARLRILSVIFRRSPETYRLLWNEIQSLPATYERQS